jgi:hypothetical protein
MRVSANPAGRWKACYAYFWARPPRHVP